ncbi:MAG: hypothetical protein J6B89_02450 [Bacilli bacterium]|nr:hypothetical protein [Bacilli bacterium]
MNTKKNIGINILVLSLALSGLTSITTGAVLNKKISKNKHNKINVEVIQKQVAKIKSNIPIPKEITIEINEPLSVNMQDYITNLDDIEDKILNKFKLDTSLVNVTQAGKYTYTINYKDKMYNGIIIVKEKELPIIENIILKDLSIELGKTLPTDISEYITTNIPEELKPNVKLNISKVNINIAGDYQYTITYNNKMYTGNVKIYQPQTTDIEKISLKSLSIETGNTLPTEISEYLITPVSKETQQNLILNTSKVDINTPGTYEYTITYNKKIYSGNVIVKEKNITQTN